VTADGGVLSYGDAGFFGSAGGLPLAAPVVGLAPTPDGHGYWMVSADGGVLNYGDAGFYGSAGGQAGVTPVVGIAATPDGHGYWLLPSTQGRSIPGLPAPGAVIRSVFDFPGSPYRPGQKVLALTFDDGPSAVYTPQILSVLEQYHVTASFEIVGDEGAEYPQLLRDEVAGGFALVNHTWTHVDLTSLPAPGWAGEVDQNDAQLSGISHHPVSCLRPPYGYTNASVVAQLAQRGLAELMWSIDPSDYTKPGASVIAQRVLSALQPGAIIILHDGGGDRSQTVAALPQIIDGARAAGYQFVSICN
jgi:peptidoglycan/xylan/chitin deacetylase (PgdA/CDA1 family)